MCGVVSSCATHSTSQEHAGNHPAGTGAPRSRKRTAPQVPARRLAATSSRRYVPWCCCYYGQFVIVPCRLPHNNNNNLLASEIESILFLFTFPPTTTTATSNSANSCTTLPILQANITHFSRTYGQFLCRTHATHNTHKSTFSLLHRMTCLS